jgi:hypothetical protein
LLPEIESPRGIAIALCASCRCAWWRSAVADTESLTVELRVIEPS